MLVFPPLLALVSCWPLNKESRVWELEDLSTSEEANLSVDLRQGQTVCKVDVRIEGEADGTFKVNDHLFQPGNIDSTITGMDWYYAEFPIVFNPISSTEGRLKVEVSFFIQE